VAIPGYREKKLNKTGEKSTGKGEKKIMSRCTNLLANEGVVTVRGDLIRRELLDIG